MVIGVDGVTAAIRRFIDGWNDRCEPFTWTKPADEILAKAIRKETSLRDIRDPSEYSHVAILTRWWLQPLQRLLLY